MSPTQIEFTAGDFSSMGTRMHPIYEGCRSDAEMKRALRQFVHGFEKLDNLFKTTRRRNRDDPRGPLSKESYFLEKAHESGFSPSEIIAYLQIV